MKRGERKVRRPHRRVASRRGIHIAVVVSLALGTMVAMSGPVGATVAGRDGRIAYSRFSGDGSRAVIIAINPAGTGLRQLTHPARASYDFNPDWAPDGKSIVFERDNTNTGTEEIYRISADGRDLRRLTHGAPAFGSEDPAYSPEGQRIAMDRAFVPPGGECCVTALFIMRADGTHFRRVTAFDSPNEVQWSPDGMALAFTAHRPNHAAVFTVRTDGSQLSRLTPWALDAEHPDWSPDGREITFASYGDGAPPGTSTNVFTINIDGSDMDNVSRLRGGQINAANPAWAPGGKHLTFVRIPGSGPNGFADVYTMRILGDKPSQIRRVTRSPLWDFRPDWGTHTLLP